MLLTLLCSEFKSKATRYIIHSQLCMYKDCFNFTMLLLYLLYSMYSMIPLKIATSFTPQLNFEKEEDLH